MARLDVDNGKSIYYEHYSGSGTPVVLVHGWGMSVRCWDLTLPALLEAGHAVAALDHRGCGHSDKDFDEVSTKSVASDVVALVRELGLNKPIVLGWSFGAAVAAQAAADLGDDLGGLVLVGPPTPRYTQAEGFPHGGTAEIMAQTMAALRDTRPDLLWGIAQGTFHADVGERTHEWMWSIFMQTSPRADAALNDLGTIDHRDLLPTIKAPALVVRGANDAVVDPAIAEVAADLLPNSRLSTYEGSGHAPFIEEREKFNAELLAFAKDPAGHTSGAAV